MSTSKTPRKVVLFSGHLIDAVDRPKPRFPPAVEPQAMEALSKALEELGIGTGDVGITEGACGGDLLFCELMLVRGASLDLRLPFAEGQFIEKSVAYAKKTPPPDRWRERFQSVRSQSKVSVREMPNERGPLPEAEDPYEKCNLWMLRDALAFGSERLHFICLWNGSGGDGPGGTAHMKDQVHSQGGHVTWLDTRKLWSV